MSRVTSNSTMNTGDWVLLAEMLGMKWVSLAAALGISPRQLYRYRDQEVPTPDKVKLAAEGLVCREVHQKRRYGISLSAIRETDK